MDLTTILIIGFVLFLCYVAYSVMSHGSSPTVEDEETQDLHQIEKMKEFQLIKETKKIQTLAEKNQLFQRAYDHLYKNSETRVQEREEEISQFSQPTSAPTFDSLQTKTYSPNDAFDFDEEFGPRDFTAAKTLAAPETSLSDIQHEKEFEESQKSASIADDEDDFISQQQEMIGNELAGLDLTQFQPQEDENVQNTHDSEDLTKEKELWDDYTPAENFKLDVLYDHFRRSHPTKNI